MTTGHRQMLVVAALVTVLSVVSFGYILVARPAYLRATAGGVPFFTPPVEHPETGEAVEVESLVEYFRGE